MSGSGYRTGVTGRAAHWVGVLVFTAGLTMTAPVFAQNTDIKPLLDRIQRLERDIRTLNSQGGRSGAPAPLASGGSGASLDSSAGGAQPNLARIELRLTSLETELREATGRAEEVTYKLDQMNQRLEKLIGDVDFRLNQLERAQAELRAQIQGNGGAPANMAAAPGTSTAPAPPGVERSGAGGSGQGFARQPGVLGTLSKEDMEKFQSQQSGPAAVSQPLARPSEAPASSSSAPAEQAAAAPGVLPDGTPEEQYAYAFGLLRQARYDDAEVALRAFVNEHGDNKLSENAKYWLGETFYVRADYVRAAEVFLEAYQADQSGPKAPDTLLKLGMSLANLDKKKEACAAFGKLASEYPDAPGNIKRLVGREQTKYGCQ